MRSYAKIQSQISKTEILRFDFFLEIEILPDLIQFLRYRAYLLDPFLLLLASKIMFSKIGLNIRASFHTKRAFQKKHLLEILIKCTFLKEGKKFFHAPCFHFYENYHIFTLQCFLVSWLYWIEMIHLFLRDRPCPRAIS